MLYFTKNYRLHIKATAFALLTIIIMSSLISAAYGAEVITAPDTKTGSLSNGIYNFRNKASGEYLNFFDSAYDILGRAYTDPELNENGQDLKVSRQSDGNYIIYPQNENGEYAFSIAKNALGSYVSAVTKTPGNSAMFKIEPQSDGTYTIIPAGIGAGNLALTQSPSLKARNFSIAGFESYRGDAYQLWEITGASPESIILSSTSLKTRVYSIGNITASVYPTYFTEYVSYSSSDENICLVDDDGSFCALALGDVAVTVTCGTKSAVCGISVTNVYPRTWYSQHNMYTGGWNGGPLANIYFSSGGSKQKFITDTFAAKGDWMTVGCALTSHAMVLNNLGAQLTEGYDIRSGQNGNLPADPYTTALANAGSYGATSSTQSLYGNPVYVNLHNITPRFNVDGKSLSTTTVNGRISKAALKTALDNHPEGVIIGMQNYYNGSHYIVVTKCENPEEMNPNNYKFTICDSAAYDAKLGDHVSFEDSISYTIMKYRFTDFTSMIVWNVEK